MTKRTDEYGNVGSFFLVDTTSPNGGPYDMGGVGGTEGSFLVDVDPDDGTPSSTRESTARFEPRNWRLSHLPEPDSRGRNDRRCELQMIVDYGASDSDGSAPFGQPEFYDPANRSSRMVDLQGRVALRTSHERIIDAEDGRFAIALTCRSIGMEEASAPDLPGEGNAAVGTTADGVGVPKGVTFREAGTTGGTTQTTQSVAVGGSTWFGEAAVKAAKRALSAGHQAAGVAQAIRNNQLGAAEPDEPDPADKTRPRPPAPETNEGGSVSQMNHGQGYVWDSGGQEIGLLGTFFSPADHAGSYFAGSEGTPIGPLPMRHDAHVTMGNKIVGAISFVSDSAEAIPIGDGKEFKGHMYFDPSLANQNTQVGLETGKWVPVIRVDAALPPSSDPPPPPIIVNTEKTVEKTKIIKQVPKPVGGPGGGTKPASPIEVPFTKKGEPVVGGGPGGLQPGGNGLVATPVATAGGRPDPPEPTTGAGSTSGKTETQRPQTQNQPRTPCNTPTSGTAGNDPNAVAVGPQPPVLSPYSQDRNFEGPGAPPPNKTAGAIAANPHTPLVAKIGAKEIDMYGYPPVTGGFGGSLTYGGIEHKLDPSPFAGYGLPGDVQTAFGIGAGPGIEVLPPGDDPGRIELGLGGRAGGGIEVLPPGDDPGRIRLGLPSPPGKGVVVEEAPSGGLGGGYGSGKRPGGASTPQWAGDLPGRIPLGLPPPSGDTLGLGPRPPETPRFDGSTQGKANRIWRQMIRDSSTITKAENAVKQLKDQLKDAHEAGNHRREASLQRQIEKGEKFIKRGQDRLKRHSKKLDKLEDKIERRKNRKKSKTDKKKEKAEQENKEKVNEENGEELYDELGILKSRPDYERARQSELIARRADEARKKREKAKEEAVQCAAEKTGGDTTAVSLGVDDTVIQGGFGVKTTPIGGSIGAKEDFALDAPLHGVEAWNTANAPIKFMGSAGAPSTIEGQVHALTYAAQAMQRVIGALTSGPEYLASALAAVHRNSPGNPPTSQVFGQHIVSYPGDDVEVGRGQSAVSLRSVVENWGAGTVSALGGGCFEFLREHRGAVTQDDRPLILLENARADNPTTVTADQISDIGRRFAVDDGSRVTTRAVAIRTQPGDSKTSRGRMFSCGYQSNALREANDTIGVTEYAYIDDGGGGDTEGAFVACRGLAVEGNGGPSTDDSADYALQMRNGASVDFYEARDDDEQQADLFARCSMYALDDGAGFRVALRDDSGDLLATPRLTLSDDEGSGDGTFLVTGNLHVTGKATIDGIVDPPGYQVTPGAATPFTGTRYGLWVNSTGNVLTYDFNGTQIPLTTAAGAVAGAIPTPNSWTASTPATMTGNLTLTDASQTIQYLNPGAATRTVNLPAEAGTNPLFVIIHTGAGNTDLTIKNNAGLTLATVEANQGARCWSDGTDYVVSVFSISPLARSNQILCFYGDVDTAGYYWWNLGSPDQAEAGARYIARYDVAIVKAGTLDRISWSTEVAAGSTTAKYYKNGAVSNATTFTPGEGTQVVTPVVLAAGDYVGLEYDAGTQTDDSGIILRVTNDNAGDGMCVWFGGVDDWLGTEYGWAWAGETASVGSADYRTEITVPAACALDRLASSGSDGGTDLDVYKNGAKDQDVDDIPVNGSTAITGTSLASSDQLAILNSGDDFGSGEVTLNLPSLTGIAYPFAGHATNAGDLYLVSQEPTTAAGSSTANYLTEHTVIKATNDDVAEVAWNAEVGTGWTVKLWKNGAAGASLSPASAVGRGTFASTAFALGDQVALEYDAGTNPQDCNYLVRLY